MGWRIIVTVTSWQGPVASPPNPLCIAACWPGPGMERGPPLGRNEGCGKRERSAVWFSCISPRSRHPVPLASPRRHGIPHPHPNRGGNMPTAPKPCAAIALVRRPPVPVPGLQRPRAQAEAEFHEPAHTPSGSTHVPTGGEEKDVASKCKHAAPHDPAGGKAPRGRSGQGAGPRRVTTTGGAPYTQSRAKLPRAATPHRILLMHRPVHAPERSGPQPP